MCGSRFGAPQGSHKVWRVLLGSLLVFFSHLPLILVVFLYIFSLINCSLIFGALPLLLWLFCFYSSALGNTGRLGEVFPGVPFLVTSQPCPDHAYLTLLHVGIIHDHVSSRYASSLSSAVFLQMQGGALWWDVTPTSRIPGSFYFLCDETAALSLVEVWLLALAFIFFNTEFYISGFLGCKFSFCHLKLDVSKSGFQSVAGGQPVSRRRDGRSPPVTHLSTAHVILERPPNRFLTYTYNSFI